MTFSDYLEGMYEADAKIERESVSELLASGDDLFKKIDEIRNNYSGVEFDVEKFQEFCKELNVNPMLIGHVIEAIFSQKAGVTVTGLGTLSPEMGASVALSSTSVDTCEDMDVTEDMEDIVLMADKSHSYMSPEMARWANVKYGNNKGALVEYKVGTSMTLPATWAEKGKAVLPLSGICVRKPQFSKPLDEEDDLRLSNMNFLKVSDLKLKKTVTYEAYHLDVERAEKAPASRNDILAKRFGIPMAGYTYFFTYEQTIPHRKMSFWSMPCSLGADLSQGDDFCAFTFIFPMHNGAFGVKTRSYITALTLSKLPVAMRQKYEEFMREGSLHILEGNVLDMMEVYDDLDAFIIENEYDVRTFGFDPYNAKEFVTRWEAENGPFGIEKVVQGARTESVPLGELKILAEERALLFDQELMSFAMGNAITMEDTNGNRKLLKKRLDEKIDNVAAMMDAYVAYKANKEAFE